VLIKEKVRKSESLDVDRAPDVWSAMQYAKTLAYMHALGWFQVDDQIVPSDTKYFAM
jgi:hypothetical protein